MHCAIYTRKSASEGLEQSFNSLDAQRLACSHYIASQAAEGWVELDALYDDGGYSGGTLARPALQRLLKDVESGKVGTVVVYKIDRLSRSLRDFVRLVEIFERHGAAFVCVTQQFGTNSSMGRLTLNMLLSFAQFEREITGERIRDKFTALRAKGMRPSGRPFGYQLKDRHLVIDQAEAAIVKRIFAMFIRFGSYAAIPSKLNQAGLLNHQGRPFTIMAVRRLLDNRLYCGDLVHRGEAMPGSHARIISERVWAKAQAIRAVHVVRWNYRRPSGHEMLKGLLFGPRGLLLHESSFSRGKLYRYYGPPRWMRRACQRGSSGRYRAAQLEQAILAAVDPDARLRRDPISQSAGVDLVRSLVERIDISADIDIVLKTGRMISIPNASALSTSRQEHGSVNRAGPHAI